MWSGFARRVRGGFGCALVALLVFGCSAAPTEAPRPMTSGAGGGAGEGGAAGVAGDGGASGVSGSGGFSGFSGFGGFGGFGGDAGSSGSGGAPVDGGVDGCVPLTCDGVGANCGFVDDGCGAQLACGSCSDPNQTCGGNGVPNRCASCVPETCETLGADCGPIGNGCGGIVQSCGVCTEPEICGGSGVPSICGGNAPGGVGGGECEGLCQNQAVCTGDQATTVTGTIYAPNGTIPLYNAMVYVPVHPSDAAPELSTGASCDRCDAESLGALVSTLSAPDGTFTLRHVPAGVDFPLVIKMGKWRRVVTISSRTACSTSALTSEQTRLPRNRNEGHIPRVAISTGSVDALECVLYKAGVDAAEFTRPEGDGRIHLYRANGAWPDQAIKSCADCSTASGLLDLLGNAANCRSMRCGGSTPAARTAMIATVSAQRLYESQAVLDGYDMTAFGCEAGENDRSGGDRDRVLQYVNKGGRTFLSHYNYDWIRTGSYNTSPLHTTATWGNGGGTGNLSDPTPAIVDTSFPKGVAFSEWLDVTNASHPVQGSGVISIDEPRRYVSNTTNLSRQWIHTTQADHGETSVQHFTFNTPVGAPEPEVCGRVVYSAFHVATGSHGGAVFPGHCTGELTPQEKVLLFMLFDLAACVADDSVPPAPPAVCNRRECGSGGEQCGVIADGCGGLDDCGPCPNGDTCIHNQCVAICTPRTCADAGAGCGTIGDNCGGQLNCGECTPPDTCGGAGTPNVCGGLG